MTEEYINPEESCLVEVTYKCPGQPLNSEMESTLTFIAGDNGRFIGGRFVESHRIVQFWFRQRINADQFCKYIGENYPEATTSLIIDYHN